MGRNGLVLLGGLAVLAPVACLAGATRCERVAGVERVLDAAFAPQGDDIAVVRYGQKHFTESGGEWAFDLVVSLLHGTSETELLRVPPEHPRGGRLQTPGLSIWWLPSGRYLLASHAYSPHALPTHRWGWLLASDGTVRTKVAAYREWFVMNQDVDLTQRDRAALNGRLQDPWLVPDMCPRWLWDGVGRFTAKPYYHSCGLSAPATGDAQAAFAAYGGSAAAPAPRTMWALGGSPGAQPRLWFTCSDPAVNVASPDGRHRLYNADASGRPNDERRFGRDLWVSRRDGSGRRLLARHAWGWHTWLNNEWVVYDMPGHSQSAGPKQLAIANIHDGRGQLLTKGAFRHQLSDFRDGRFLVTEAPLTGKTRYPNSCTQRLYIIEPLRVEL